MQRRRFVSASAALGAAVLPARTWAQGTRAIVLGQSAALTGPASELGEQFRRGALLHFERVNSRGGIAGRSIELLSLDDGYEPDRCAANTRQLIDRGVTALFGYIGTPTSLAALPLATAARLPFVAPFSGAEALRTPFNRHVFHVRASYFDETAAIVRQIQSVGVRKLAVFHQNDSYGQAGLEGVTRAAAALKVELAGLGTVERNTEQVESAVKSILASTPGAIVMISAYKSCAAFIRAARQAGYGGSFYNVSFVGTLALAQALGEDARGVIVSQVMPYPFSAATALAADYLAAGRATAGDGFQPNYSGIEGFVAARVLTEALRRPAAATSSEGLIQALESLHDLNLGGFFVDFGAQKHQGSRFVELTMLGSGGRVLR